MPDTIVANRWYDIALEVGIDTVKCFLDGKLLMSYTEPDKLFAIAGKDNANGNIIVKVVNAYGNEVPVNIDLQHASATLSKVKLITLSAPSLTDENSFEHPVQYYT